MERKMTKKCLEGSVLPLDNTRVEMLRPLKYKLTPELATTLRLRKFLKLEKLNLSYVYDTDRADYYRNMLNFYNNNFFGYGAIGLLTRHDYTTPKGLKAIQSNFDYAKSNVQNLGENIAMAGLAGAASKTLTKGSLLYSKLFKGPFRTPSKRGSLGTMKLYVKNGTIGSGSEAVVINNTPTTVGKITTIPLLEMMARNAIPNVVQSKYVGFVKDKGTKLPTYILRKVKTLTEETFPKYIEKLDNSMAKSGFRRVNDPNVQYRAYTNGLVVVDDISPGNVGLDWLKRPKMIDFNLLSVPEWLALGFTLKEGGKFPDLSESYKGYNKASTVSSNFQNVFSKILGKQDPSTNNVNIDPTVNLAYRISKEYDWMDNWLKNRTSILGQNAVGNDNTNYSKDQLNKIGEKELSTLLARRNNSYTIAPLLFNNENDKIYKATLKKRLQDSGKPGINPIKETLEINKEGVKGSYGKNIIYYSGNPFKEKDANNIIHESSHALGKYYDKIGAIKPQSTEIENSKKTIKNWNNTVEDKYLDKGEEIYSRLMEIRRLNNIDPNKVWTNEEINNLRKDPSFKDRLIFDRYSNDFILNLFNNIASNNLQLNSNYLNNNFKLDLMLAKYGKKF